MLFGYKFPVEYLVLNKHNVFYSFNAVLILIKLIDLSLIMVAFILLLIHIRSEIAFNVNYMIEIYF